MKVFWIVLILSLLFVIGSASALRYLDRPSKNENDQSNNQEK